MSDSPPTRSFPVEYAARLDHWARLSRRRMVLHYACGLAAMVLVAMIPIFDHHRLVQFVFSTVSVVCVAIVTFPGARRSAKALRQAWRTLDVARLRYLHDPTMTDADVQGVLEACESRLAEREADG